MMELTQDVSWIAVIVGAVLAFFAGWAWYSPIGLGNRWAQGLGIDMGGKPPVTPMMLQGLGLFLLSWFVAVTAASGALMTLLLGALAFVVLGYSGESFAGHTPAVRLINSGYWVLAVVVMILTNAVL
ncbi:MAG TPA: DUF1761 domain-containing protein [Alphaproteobacteria bacterium]|jgi:hypothetical protein|nr:DUF1761 domain-containing protein [Alphaproteobacteria bacterium]|tara:strand:+ start:172 stop:552 length:381 start_codon:yes stop_codon:yes gene_type:complete